MQKSVFDTVLTGGNVRTSHAQVVNELGRAIVAGDFPVGSILPGDPDLAGRFKVSRTVLREAMKTLAAKGMIVPRARIGTRVTPATQWNLFDRDVLAWHFQGNVDEAFLIHLSEIRLAFEPHAAALAAHNASEAQIEQMMRLAMALGNTDHTPESFAAADLKFHLAIVEACANPFMRTVGNLIEAALAGIFKLSSPDPNEGRIEEVARTHIRIVEEISRRDGQGARLAMENVIRDGRERIASLFKNAAPAGL